MMAIDNGVPREVHEAAQLRALVELAASWPTDEQRARFLARVRDLQGDEAADSLRLEIWECIKRKQQPGLFDG